MFHFCHHIASSLSLADIAEIPNIGHKFAQLPSHCQQQFLVCLEDEWSKKREACNPVANAILCATMVRRLRVLAFSVAMKKPWWHCTGGQPPCVKVTDLIRAAATTHVHKTVSTMPAYANGQPKNVMALATTLNAVPMNSDLPNSYPQSFGSKFLALTCF